MSAQLHGYLIILIGIIYIVWPAQISELNDYISTSPKSFSKGFVVILGIIAVSIGVASLMLQPHPV